MDDEDKLMDEILKRFIEATPVAVMVQATLRRVFADSALDALFERCAQSQYTRELTFSTVIRLMVEVVTKKHPSLHAAYRNAPEQLPVTVASIYNKINGLETGVSSALVLETATAMQNIVENLPGRKESKVAGLRLRTLDGNFLAGSEHRLDCLRDYGAAALPGMSLVVRDGGTGLLTDLIPCEDAYTSERSLFPDILALVHADDLWLADRNFCTLDYMGGIAERKAFFLIRHHRGTHLHTVRKMTACGSNASGKVYEQRVRIGCLECRCIIVRLYEPLRDGSTELRILTNVPAKRLSAKRALKLYHTRWRIETAFQELTENLRCEIDTLGYPQAALFAFCLAAAAYNILVVTRAALASAHASTASETEQVEQTLSSYYLAHEVAAATEGMLIAVPQKSWQRLVRMPLPEFAVWLTRVAARAQFWRYRKSPRGPKKPRTVRRTWRGAHRSTARLLAKKAHK
jgi:Transposase DDE domain